MSEFQLTSSSYVKSSLSCTNLQSELSANLFSIPGIGHVSGRGHKLFVVTRSTPEEVVNFQERNSTLNTSDHEHCATQQTDAGTLFVFVKIHSSRMNSRQLGSFSRSAHRATNRSFSGSVRFSVPSLIRTHRGAIRVTLPASGKYSGELTRTISTVLLGSLLAVFLQFICSVYLIR